jgi:hypothetical protein
MPSRKLNRDDRRACRDVALERADLTPWCAFHELRQTVDRRRRAQQEIMQAVGSEVLGNHRQPDVVQRAGLDGVDQPGGTSVNGPAGLHVGRSLDVGERARGADRNPRAPEARPPERFAPVGPRSGAGRDECSILERARRDSAEFCDRGERGIVPVHHVLEAEIPIQAEGARPHRTVPGGQPRHKAHRRFVRVKRQCQA